MKKLSLILIKFSLLFALTMTFPAVKSPNFVTFADGITDPSGPPIDDGSSDKAKQGAEKKEAPASSSGGIWGIIAQMAQTVGKIIN